MKRKTSDPIPSTRKVKESMPRYKAIKTPAPDPFAALSDEELINHPFVQIMARWVREAEAERRAQAKAKKPHKPKAAQARHPVDEGR